MLKIFAWPLAAVALCCAGLSAQSNPAKAIEQAAKAAVVKHNVAQQQKKPVCIYCGEEILDVYHQSCSHQDNDEGICTSYKKSAVDRTSGNVPAFNGKGDPHNQPVKVVCVKTAGNKAPKCVYCGEEILSKGQHCQANDYCSLCTDVKDEADRTSGNTPAFNGIGDPHNQQVTVVCQKTENNKAPKCVYCSEEIHSNGQHCQASDYCTLCTDVKEEADRKAGNTSAFEGSGDPHANETYAADSVKKVVVHTCSFCDKPMLQGNQKCEGKDNPWSVCTNKDLNWGTKLHKGTHKESREKMTYNVPFESRKVKVTVEK